jgi:hypothetical protein
MLFIVAKFPQPYVTPVLRLLYWLSDESLKGLENQKKCAAVH